jgi:hypothetical protein
LKHNGFFVRTEALECFDHVTNGAEICLQSIFSASVAGWPQVRGDACQVDGVAGGESRSRRGGATAS